MKPFTVTMLCLASLVLTLAATSCGRSVASQSGKDPGARVAEVVPESAAGRAAGAQEGSEEQELSDLDRPVDDLFRATCEHDKRTFECDLCRYEVGVVHAPRELIDGGLLRTRRVVREPIEFPLQLTGEVQFDERRVAHLSTQAEGIVRGVHVVLGDRVRRGQALVEIESVVVGEAEGAYLEALAVLRLARRNHQRVAELQQEAIASEKEYLQSRQELEAAEIRAESALGVLTRLGMSAADARQLDQASARGRLVLRAPAAGRVLFLHAVPGEIARAEESLATIGDNSTVWVWANLYERDIARVVREQRGKRLSAVVTVRAYPGEEFPGTVDLLSPSMDEASRTVRVRVEVKNLSGRLLAGMFAEVRVFLPGREEALVLPRSAVLEDEGRDFVFIHHHGDYYVRRPVETGRSWAERVELVKGLGAGDLVVADGAFLLKSDVLRSKMGAGCAD